MNTINESEPTDDSLLREIEKENCRYDRLRELVKSSLQQNRREKRDIQLVVRLLEEFRDGLALHFALEIASETFKDAIDEAPRLVPQVESLLEVQELLYTDICEIADFLQRHREAGKERVPESIVDRWNLFNQKLKEHDAAERELIFDAYFQDIGTGG